MTSDRMKSTMRPPAMWAPMVFILALASCAGLQKTSLESGASESNCHQTDPYSYTAEDLPEPVHTLELDTALTNRLSFQSLNVANAIGLLERLTAYIHLIEEHKSNPSIENSIEILEFSQKINERMNIASLEISAVASEIDCEEERAEQVASYLKAREDNASTKLTVGAIVVGAAGAIAAGVVLANGNAGNTPEVIGIATGLTEATLGVLILLNKRKIDYYHPRNTLRDVWKGPEVSADFPPSVWYYLTYENPQKEEKMLRQQLVDKWLGFGQMADTKEKNKEKVYSLFFGKGGEYTTEQLKSRSEMLDQLEAQIALMKQDLLQLASDIEMLNTD